MEKVMVEAIQTRLKPKTLIDAWSFYDLIFFYKMLVPNINTIMASITKYMKKGYFKWNLVASKTFDLTKQMLCKGFILALLDFDKLFEVECDISQVGIKVVLTQSENLLAYFSEKLNETKKRYFIYDKRFYAIVKALDH